MSGLVVERVYDVQSDDDACGDDEYNYGDDAHDIGAQTSKLGLPSHLEWRFPARPERYCHSLLLSGSM